MVFFVRITVNQSHLRPICKSTKFNPKIQRTIYLINFQQLRLHVPDFIRTVVISHAKKSLADIEKQMQKVKQLFIYKYEKIIDKRIKESDVKETLLKAQLKILKNNLESIINL